LEYLLEKEADPNEYMPDGDSILLGVIRMGFLSCVELLYKYEVDIHHKRKDERNALYTAVEHSHPEIVMFLLEKGADPNIEGPNKETPLHLSLRKGDEWISRILLFGGSGIEKKDKEGESTKDLAKKNSNLKQIVDPIK
jgi:ankyrin repeat protein